MSASAAVTLRRRRTQPADELRRRGRTPAGRPDAKRLRRNAVNRPLVIDPRPRVDDQTHPRLAADLTRTGAWSFLVWRFVEGHLRPDLDLLLAKNPGDLYQQWTARHPDDVARIVQVAERFGWSSTWTTDVSRGGLSLLCLTAGKTLDELTDDDFDTFADALAQAPSEVTTPGPTTPPPVQPAPCQPLGLMS